MNHPERNDKIRTLLVGAVASAVAVATSAAAIAWDQDPGLGGESTLPQQVHGFGSSTQQEQPPASGQQTDRARGMAALAKARAHMAAAEWQQAADEYRTASRLMPENEEAKRGLDAALARLDQASGLERTQEDLIIRAQQAKAEFDAAMQNARELLSQDQFAEARNVVLTAKVRLATARNVLNEAEIAERNDRADTLLAQIDQAQEAHALETAERAQVERERQLREQERREAERRQEQIRQNLIRVRELQLERKYDEALQVIDQILFLDEGNPVALLLRDVIQTAAVWQSYISNERLREFSYANAFEENRRAMQAPIPNIIGPGPKSTTGLMTYPEDWPSLSHRRISGAGFLDSEPNRRIAAALEKNIHSVDFNGNSFESAIAYLRTVTEANIHTDWQALDFVGVTPDMPVTLRLKNVPVRRVLDLVLEQVGSDLSRPRYAIQEGVLFISSEDAIRQHVVTLVYDIADLLFEVPYFDNAPDMDLEKQLAEGNASRALARTTSAFASTALGSSRSGSAGGDFVERSNPHLFNEGGVDPNRPTRETKIDQIIEVIQGNIDPDGWRDFGGDVGSIQELSGNLVITQTPRNHQQIEGLLSQLREIRALQINVESRFLTVDMNWFEQIGFDLDLFFNTNSDLFAQARAIDPTFHLSDFFFDDGRLKDPLIFDSFSNTNAFANKIGGGFQFGIPTGTPPTDITYITGPVGPPLRATDGFTPSNVQQDSLSLVELLGGFAGDSFAGTILSSNPAFAFGIQFLDDVQVDLLIKATQADRRNVVLTAPRLTLFNGQRSWVLVGTQLTYISALIPIVGDNSGAFQPIPDVLTDGVVLDVEAVISADRRYVTMTVITGIRETINIETVTFQGAAGGGGGGGGGGGAAAIFEGSISLPEVEVILVQTTASVPDRGTLLLGGQRLVDETEIEVGVPVLSKIPFLNRFFTNRLTARDESTLLVLVRPEIIIQQENEDILFPGLSDALGTQ